MADMFDFEDGGGAVPAKRHPNGGGWVAATAFAARGAYVGEGARVFGHAHLFDTADVRQQAQVFGNAEVEGRVHDRARVYGEAWVMPSGTVKGDACVYGTRNNREAFASLAADQQPLVPARPRIAGLVGEKARVFDPNTFVDEDAIVEGFAWVYGGAQIRKSAVLGGAHVVGADLEGCLIGGRARIEKPVILWSVLLGGDSRLGATTLWLPEPHAFTWLSAGDPGGPTQRVDVPAVPNLDGHLWALAQTGRLDNSRNEVALTAILARDKLRELRRLTHAGEPLDLLIIELAGEAGRELAERVGIWFAAALIYTCSRKEPFVPRDFRCSNAEAFAMLRQHAPAIPPDDAGYLSRPRWT